MNSLNAFIITTFAGLSTLIGAFIILFSKNSITFLTKALAFSSGVMFSLSLFDLIPESIKFLNTQVNVISNLLIVLLFIFLGFLITFILDKRITIKIKDQNIYKLGILTMITIIIHNIPEGIATFITLGNNFTLGINLAIAISMHNIPEGISTALPIYHHSKSKKKALIYAAITAVSEPFGALIAYLFLKPTYFTLGIIYSIIAGIMIYIAMLEILPNIIKNKNYKIILIFYSLGIIFILLNKILF